MTGITKELVIAAIADKRIVTGTSVERINAIATLMIGAVALAAIISLVFSRRRQA